ncbi:hypothetical protein Tco_1087267 [Tanacetum coccineum]
MLCHGDLIFALVLRRGSDEFCVSSGLRPSMAKGEAFFGNVPEEVLADIKLVMPFNVGVLPIKYLGMPMMSKRLTSKDCKPLIKMIKKRIRDWRNKVKIGNGNDCNIWFDKWHTRGPLSRLINHEVLKQANLCLKTKVCNMIDGNEWNWPIEWDDRFDVVKKILVPRLDANIKDKTVWVDKNWKEKSFSVKEVWRAIRDDCTKVIWYEHVWYSQCIPRYAFISKWMEIQSMAR